MATEWDHGTRAKRRVLFADDDIHDLNRRENERSDRVFWEEVRPRS